MKRLSNYLAVPCLGVDDFVTVSAQIERRKPDKDALFSTRSSVTKAEDLPTGLRRYSQRADK
jgi:hypothetical protein